MTDYKPGTFAVATVQGVPHVRVMALGRRDGINRWAAVSEHLGPYIFGDEDLTDVQPVAGVVKL